MIVPMVSISRGEVPYLNGTNASPLLGFIGIRS